MTAEISWAHIGDLHIDADDGWRSLARFEAAIDEINRLPAGAIDFVFLPGDNANHGTGDQYDAILAALARLVPPYRVIPGDHDFEPGDLTAYEDAFPEANRPEAEVIAGHRCIFLDIVSAGYGGPDFRLTMQDRDRIDAEIARAQADATTPLVFMHAYPDDLAADGDSVAQAFANGGVAFVDTGHTHYNELLNDGRVLYGAVRSTGQIEDGDGAPGYALVTVRDGVVAWGFKPIGGGWPFVQIVAPSDRRLVTRPADPRQVPRPGPVEFVVKLFGAATGAVMLAVDGGAAVTMAPAAGGLWTAIVPLGAGLSRVVASCGAGRDEIGVLVRGAGAIPKRRVPVAPGRAIHAIGAWPDRGIDGAQLGPNKNGKGW